ncbi:MAG: hypothetical protein HY255_01180 [Betaproteobacteria bacterium]|nr:hypothetical protein [Betaproteobacteria bacterium]
MKHLGKVVATLTLCVAGALGLLASLCGGFFTIVALFDFGDSREASAYAKAFLIISVPSLVIGGIVAWVAFRYLSRLSKAAPVDSGQDAQPQD